ncbi:hypothetical protein [Pyrolobus fumarii]|uniref:hypothetical protein n=1 Tax=Pyrolobus fumarii TaxID=54252 RepID=UPI000689242A|nr:hypothetical protein [Pyrolobus fumarii]
MAKLVTGTGFLWVEVCNRRYEHDVVVLPGCIVRRRWAKSLSKKYADLYGHPPLSREELEVYLREAGEVDCVVIGTGQEGRMRITPDAEKLLGELEKERGVKVIVAETPMLVGLELDCERLLAVIHVTC